VYLLYSIFEIKLEMLVATIIAVLMYFLVEKYPEEINVWLLKLLVQIYTLGGGLYAFSLIAEATDTNLLVLLLYVLVFIGVNIYIVGWRMADMSASEIREDAKNAMSMAKICPNCLKKLPSRMSKKCPHCTADL
jgi:hypothetical protein